MTEALLLTAILVGQINSHDNLNSPARPTSYRPPELNGAGVQQKLGQQVPLDLPFRDHTGKVVKLQDFCGQRPVVLVLAYFKCPMLCTEVLNGLFESLPKSGLSPDQYEIVVVSFDAREGSELADAKRKHYLDAFGRLGLDQRVHFLTGEQSSIDTLSKSIGFGFGYDAKSDQFAHPGMITLLTQTGTIARYFFGIRFQPRDLRLGLVEASEGKIGSLTDAIVLYCLFYDPNGATYAASVLNIVRAAGAVTVFIIVGLVVWARWREKKNLPALTRPGSLGATGFAKQ